MEVLHLLFANDTLILCDANKEHMECLSYAYVVWSDLRFKINLKKIEVIPMGEVANSKLVGVLGCRVGSLPTTYLSLPLGAPFKSLQVWDVVEKRLHKQLAMWKRQSSSKGGRSTLVKRTLSSLAIYFVSLFIISCKVSFRPEKIQKDFLWGLSNLPWGKVKP